MATLLADAAAARGATVDTIAAVLHVAPCAAAAAALNSSSSRCWAAGLVMCSNPGGGSSVLRDILQVQSTDYTYSVSMYSINRKTRTNIEQQVRSKGRT